MNQSSDPALAPRLTLRIGVTGHRPNKLSADQRVQVAQCSEAILECLSQAAQHVKEAYPDVLSKQEPDLRLATSLAEGADTIVAGIARKHGYSLDVVLPFPREAYAQAQNFSAAALKTFESYLGDPSPHSLLELDGDPDSCYSANLGYLAAGRRVVAHSDILIAVWNGEREAGVGGTAQVLREAIDRGVPVIWIWPDGDACIISDLIGLSDFHDNKPIITHGGSCSKDLGRLVHDLLAPPSADCEAGLRLRRFFKEPERKGSSWSYYDLMRTILTGRQYRRKLDYTVNQTTEDAWKRFHERAHKIGGADFAAALKDKLEPRWRRADNVALHCSHAYRSTYIVNFLLAGVAVLVGLISVFWWTTENSILAKAACVSIEVILIFVILRLTHRGSRASEDWHVRWLDARSTAELLRSARLLTLFGSTAAPHDKSDYLEDDAWVEWYARATLREIGPPTGRLDANAIRTAITSAVEDEITEQIKYNSDAANSYHVIDHKLHVCGEVLFKATLFIGVAYVFLALVYEFGNEFDLIYVDNNLKNVVKSIVTVLGAGMPAFGAAFFGIRATGDFKLVSEQAGRTLRELSELRTKLETEAAKVAPTREQASHLLSSLTQALVSDLRGWTKVYRARELQLPG